MSLFSCDRFVLRTEHTNENNNEGHLCKRYKDAIVKAFHRMASLLYPRFKLLPFLSSKDKEAAHSI